PRLEKAGRIVPPGFEATHVFDDTVAILIPLREPPVHRAGHRVVDRLKESAIAEAFIESPGCPSHERRLRFARPVPVGAGKLRNLAVGFLGIAEIEQVTFRDLLVELRDADGGETGIPQIMRAVVTTAGKRYGVP